MGDDETVMMTLVIETDGCVKHLVGNASACRVTLDAALDRRVTRIVCAQLHEQRLDALELARVRQQTGWLNVLEERHLGTETSLIQGWLNVMKDIHLETEDKSLEE